MILRCHGQAVLSAVFSADGRRIAATCADDVLIWQVDGAGEPVILEGHKHLTADVRFSPDDRRIASASVDGTIRVWHDLAPVPLDDPRLWAATSYCMPIERRTELLGVSEAQARRDRQRCLELVERAARRP
jgi:WD40 repeat protein